MNENHALRRVLRSVPSLSRRRVVIVLASLVVATGVPVGLASAAVSGGAHNSDRSIAHAAVTQNGADLYPTSSCDSADPTALLLPSSELPPGLTLTGEYSSGGQSISPLAIPESGVTPPSSGALLIEHAANMTIPTTALDGSDPYLAANPTTVTTFDEGITGFTDPATEGLFYDRASQNGGVTPEVMANGEAVAADVSTTTNDSLFPTPNVVVVTSGPAAADQATSIEITVEAGSTVVGISFSGGVDLTVSDVSSFADEALSTISSACNGLDVMS
jgi:hypothetical protein